MANLTEEERQEKKQANKLQALERQRKLRIDDFVRAAVTTHQGREYLWWLMEIAKTHYQPFSGNALTTSFNCGEMNIGKQIFAHILEVAPKGYLQMLTEKQEEEENAKRPEPDAGPDETSGTESDN